jgi:hypothetical protein
MLQRASRETSDCQRALTADVTSERTGSGNSGSMPSMVGSASALSEAMY